VITLAIHAHAYNGRRVLRLWVQPGSTLIDFGSARGTRGTLRANTLAGRLTRRRTPRDFGVFET
jgi:hypothetical protein